MSESIRVVIADDSLPIRRGVRMVLDSTDDIEVVGEAEDGQEAVDLTKRLAPDVVVMDISMPRMDGLRATRLIQALGTSAKVLILSMHNNPTFVRKALRQGARGYVLKRRLAEELLPAIYRVKEGERYLSPALGRSADLSND